jgi:Fe-S-cluster containining protein
MRPVAGDDFPDLRRGVAAVRSRSGVLVYDAHRARMLFVPAGKGDISLRRWLSAQGVTADVPVPPVSPRIAQLFMVSPQHVPEAGLKTTPEARFTCSACGTSCRTLNLGPLFPADVDRMLALDWSGTGFDPKRFFCDRDGNEIDDERLASRCDLFLRRENDACQFLRADNLCDVHVRFGMRAKPYMCRAFPAQLRASPTGIVAGMRLGECMRAEAALNGPEMAADTAEIRTLWGEMPVVPLLPPLVWLAEGSLVTWDEYESLERALLDEPANPRVPGAHHGAGIAFLLRSVDAVARRAGAPLPAPCPPERLAALRTWALGLDEQRGSPPIAHVSAAALDERARRLEESIARLRLFNKDAFQLSTVLSGVSQLAVAAWLAREHALLHAGRDGAPLAGSGHLNHAVKEQTLAPLRDRLRELGLDPVAAASGITQV